MSFSPWNPTHLVSHLILPKQIFSRFSDTFMEKLSLFLHSYLNIASLFLVHSLICSLALRLPAEISSLVLQYSRTPWQSQDAFWRNSAAAINCKPYPDQTSTLQGCAEDWQKGGGEFEPREIPLHRYTGESTQVQTHLAFRQQRQAYLLHFIMRRWWARSPKAFRCFDI